MSVIQDRLRPVQMRMGVNRFLTDALKGLVLGWSIAAVLLLLDRILGFGIPLAWVPVAATVAPLAAAAISAWARRASLRQAAVLADGRLGLAERLSSALLVSGRTPMEAAVLADADRHLGRLRPDAACPMVLSTRRVRVAAAIALAALVGVLCLPSWDLLGRQAAADARAKAKLQAETLAKAVEVKVKKLSDEAKARGEEPSELGKGLEKLAKEMKDGIQDPAQILAEIKDMEKKLQEEAAQFKDKDQAALAKDLKKAMEEMAKADGKTKSPDGSQADALKDLAQKMQELASQMEAAKTDPAAKEAAEAAKEEMKKTLEALAEALNKAGASKELAAELKRAAKELGKEQGKDAMPQLADNLKNLGKELEKMDKAMDQEQAMEMAKADLEDLKDKVAPNWKSEVSEEDMEAFKEKMKEMEEAGKECEGGEGCPGCGGKGCKGKGGRGMGGGLGEGPRPEGVADNVKFDRTKLKGVQGEEGEIVGSFFVKGVPPKGPAEVKYVEMLGKYEHENAEALEKEPIPVGQREQVRKYFDSLKPEAKTEPDKPKAP